MASFLDPVILFFILGVASGLLKSDLKIPKAIYVTLSAYLLLSIGIKGGIELSHSTFSSIVWPAIGTVSIGIGITLLANQLLRRVWGFDAKDSVAIATHYGSVSAVTFAVVLTYLETKGVFFESYMTVLLVLLEIPAIVVGVGMSAVLPDRKKALNVKRFLHDVFLGKSILLLVGGLGIGLFIGYSHNDQLNFFFIDLFKGFLAIFMLEMGVVTAERIEDLKKVGLKLILFGLIMPLIAACIGILVGYYTGLSMGGTVVLATLAASSSYIAAPAAIRVAIPEANPTLYLTASLGVTFPFNIIIGIQLYHGMTSWWYGLMG